MPLEGLRWSRDSGSTLCDTPQNGRSRTGWGGKNISLCQRLSIMTPILAQSTSCLMLQRKLTIPLYLSI